MSRVRLYSFQSSSSAPMIWTGTCGFGRRQTDVLAQLDAVEIQETFYRPVSAERAIKWRAKAPQHFPFSGGAAQFITHQAASPPAPPAGRGISHSGKPPDRSFRGTPPGPGGWGAHWV